MCGIKKSAKRIQLVAALGKIQFGKHKLLLIVKLETTAQQLVGNVGNQTLVGKELKQSKVSIVNGLVLKFLILKLALSLVLAVVVRFTQKRQLLEDYAWMRQFAQT